MEHTAYQIKIMGHTDNTGAEQATRTLSEDRAKAVAEYLISKGISKSRIECSGFGSLKPIDTNAAEYGRSKIRRGEFIILENP